MTPVISVIIPVWREASIIESCLASLGGLREAGHEVVVVDGGSDDDTASLAQAGCDHVLVTSSGRAAQMNAGACLAQGVVLVFLHADTRLPPMAVERLLAFAESGYHWGRFDVRLSGNRWLFRVIEWFMNHRSRLTGIATGDQAIFVRRSVFESVSGYSNQPLMEDVDLCRRLRQISAPLCIAEPVVTDSRRWESKGVLRTIWLMWRLRWRYWRGESPETLAREYRSDVRQSNPRS